MTFRDKNYAYNNKKKKIALSERCTQHGDKNLLKWNHNTKIYCICLKDDCSCQCVAFVFLETLVKSYPQYWHSIVTMQQCYNTCVTFNVQYIWRKFSVSIFYETFFLKYTLHLPFIVTCSPLRGLFLTLYVWDVLSHYP